MKLRAPKCLSIALLCALLLPAQGQDSNILFEKEALIQSKLEQARAQGAHRLEGQLYEKWGEALLNAGDLERALEKLESAAAVFESANAWNGYGRVLILIGRLHRTHGNYRQAIQRYTDALAIFRSVGDRAGESEALRLMGMSYHMSGNHREGLELIQQAVEIARQLPRGNLLQSRLLMLGYAYTQTGEPQRAIDLLEDLLRQGVTTRPLLFWSLSTAYFQTGRYDIAESMATQGLDLALSLGKPEAARFCLQAREGARRRLGRLEEAAADIEEALRLSEQIRSRLVPMDFMKLGFASKDKELVNDAVDVLYALGRYKRAFEVAEQARGRAFLDLLASRRASNEIPTDLDLTDDSLMLSEDDFQLPSTTSVEPATFELVVGEAKRLGSTVITYWFNSDAAYIWVIQPEGAIHCVRVRVSEKRLSELISQAGSRAEATRPALQELYRYLIGSVRHHLPRSGSRLTIIPHGSLFDLPFAVLIDDRGKYFLEDYAIHYAPAIATFELIDKRRESQKSDVAANRYLLAANPTKPPRMPDGSRLSPLAGSSLELEKIAARLPAGSSQVLNGSALRVDDLKRSLSDHTVIHFATHAVVDAARPLDSFLALSYGERLTTRDVYSTSLRADMVMLSACRSASGAVSADGVLGLTRAFFYAGAASVVASVWDIPDDVAPDLVADFYEQYRLSGQKDRSLRTAQLRLLGRLRAGNVQISTAAGLVALREHPALWAGFVLLGEPQ